MTNVCLLIFWQELCPPDCLDWYRWHAARRTQQVCCGSPLVECRCAKTALLGQTGTTARPGVEGRPDHSVVHAGQVM